MFILKRLFSSKTENKPKAFDQDLLMKSKEGRKFQKELDDSLLGGFEKYQDILKDYVSIKYPNYVKFLFKFLSDSIIRLSEKNNEIIKVAENTFLSVLTFYMENLEKCKNKEEESQCKSEFEKNSKLVIDRAKEILKKEFEKEFRNLKDEIETNLKDKKSAKIEDVKNRFKKWIDDLKKVLIRKTQILIKNWLI